MDDNLVNSGEPIKSKSQGRQTLFRVTYRTQINLIRIADNKANMILGINAMIISVLIGMIGSRIIFSNESFSGNLTAVIPIALIMLTSLFTVLFAIRAAQPNLIKSKESNSDEIKKESLLFFENVWSMSTDEYISKMETLLNSPQDIYKNMIIDIQGQGAASKIQASAHCIYNF